MPRRKRRFFKIFTNGHDYRPDWRWMRANELMSELASTHGRSKGYCSPQVEGSAVSRLYRYLRTMRMGYLQERRQAKIMQEFIDLQEAIAINDEGGVKRLELRLRLFVGQSSDLISKIMEVDAKVVAAYSIYFFDVREKRHRDVFQFRQRWPGRSSAKSIEDLKYDHIENFLYFFMDRISCSLIPMALDAYVHRGETHDLKTKIGRQREQVELHYLRFLASVVEPAADFGTSLRVANLTKVSNFGLTSFAKPSFLEHWQAVVNEMPDEKRTEVLDVDYVAPQERQKPAETAACSPAVWKISKVRARYPRSLLSLA